MLNGFWIKYNYILVEETKMKELRVEVMRRAVRRNVMEVKKEIGSGMYKGDKEREEGRRGK